MLDTLGLMVKHAAYAWLEHTRMSWVLPTVLTAWQESMPPASLELQMCALNALLGNTVEKVVLKFVTTAQGIRTLGLWEQIIRILAFHAPVKGSFLHQALVYPHNVMWCAQLAHMDCRAVAYNVRKEHIETSLTWKMKSHADRIALSVQTA